MSYHHVLYKKLSFESFLERCSHSKFFEMVRPIPILIIFLHLAIQTTSATCFRRDGTVDSSATVCDSTAGAASVCCDSGSSCQSNGVCQKASSDPDPLHGSYSVDSCTDSTWSSPVCLGQCSVSIPRTNGSASVIYNS